MAREPNKNKKEIHLTISPETQKWIKEHSWFNASGFFEDAVRQLQASLEENEFFKPLR